MYNFNKTLPLLSDKGVAANDCLVCMYTSTGYVGTDSYSLELVGAGEYVGELESRLAFENADNYGIVEGCNCDESEEDCECDTSDGIEGVAFIWQLSRCGNFIGGGPNDGEVLEALRELGGIVYHTDAYDAVTSVDFNVARLRELVDLTIDEAGELKYLERMISETITPPPLFVYL